MGTFLVYIFKSALCLAAFYLFYRLLLSRDTFHRFNRVALLAVLVLAAVMPLVEVSTVQPSAVGQTMLTLEEWLALAETMAEVTPAEPVEPSRAVWPLVLLVVYGVGVLFFLLRNGWSLFRLGQLLRGTQREDIRRYVADAPRVLLLVHEQDIAPFSWMRCVVIARKDLEEDGRPILLHELAHIRLRHSWDLLLADLCCFLQWFNPAAWLLKQELQAVHEYEADEAVLCAGVNAREYQLLLIKKAVGTRLYSMANSLNHSKLKKRITMMQRRKSNPWARAKLLYVLPLAAVAVAAFARPEVSGVSNQLSDAKVTDLAAVVKAESEKSAVVQMPQDTSVVSKQKDSSAVYDMVTEAPEFPGGSKAMMEYLKTNMRYPQIAKENGIQGRVILQFVVDETGKVRDPKILRGVDPALDLEAIRLVEAMPQWTPGKQDGKAVAVRYTVPVSFKLDSEEEASSKDGVLSIKAGNMPDVSGEINRFLVNPDSVTILIDGIPATEETFRALSPDRIASVSVLKDKLGNMAAAKGKKAVIAIATNSGKPGIVVSGNVKDEKGEPILGALVRVVGSVKKGVVTDGQGNFTITVPEGSLLEFSFINHSIVMVKAQPKLEVTLKAE